jgi:hypothetical protein
MKRTILAAALLTIPAAVFAQNVKVNADVDRSLKSIKADDIKKDITYLADDKLKGRLPGTEGYKLAGDYVIEQLKAAHIEPAGENGTYLQHITLRKATVTGSSFQVLRNNKS